MDRALVDAARSGDEEREDPAPTIAPTPMNEARVLT